MSKVEFHVKIGQIVVARDGEVVKTVLGSCVGIALVWRRRAKVALAHCLLPEPFDQPGRHEAHFVSQAVPKLLERLGAKPQDLIELEAIVAGGGQMLDGEIRQPKFVVGPENLKAAKKYLAQYKIKVAVFEPGGEQATRMRVDPATGEIEIERITKAS